jgi:RHH-type proline utilization regulon transcriptional repressor/proline dehydrogenase/delta 1-pyrroline-5-carboxylate dehydrogenase
MADGEKKSIVRLGHRLRIYMPYGELIPGMAYLGRRLLENTSNNSFVRAGFVENVAIERLLENPVDLGHVVHAARVPLGVAREPRAPHEETSTMSDSTTKSIPAPFRNEPPIDFAVEKNRQAMQEALQRVAAQLGNDYPLVFGGREIETNERFRSLDPSFFDRLVGTVCAANREHVQQAVAAARDALPAWRDAGAATRAMHLRRLAQALRDQLMDVAAWEVFECGKGWREATGDVCEAIDFCEYYATGAEALEQPQGADVPGEENRFEYLPRGVTAVIAPWNFPLAILTGMTAAALATGNAVVMKPSEQSSVIAALLMRLAQQAEFPPGVLNFLPGRGEIVGAGLVEHPDIAMIAFTGSRAVGTAIHVKAAEVSGRGLGYVKRVIAEMGGKNAIVVDNDADLDEAVLGVVRSAFGYQGQKCSACSRVIVLNEVYDTFLQRLTAAARSLHVGPAESPATDVGPVIDEDSFKKIHEYIAVARKESREVLAVNVGRLAEQGYFIGPHIFAEVSPQARIAQEEIFGPVLAVIRAQDLDQALSIANGTEYALTGGVYSRSPKNLDRVRKEFMVGNLYLNRPITGALVGRHPFGGFKMSGIGTKAGGPDYLLQFVLPRTITENTMRRGFAPE